MGSFPTSTEKMRARVIRCRFIFSGKNDEPTPDFPSQVDEVVLEGLEGELLGLDGEEAAPPGLHQAEGEPPAASEDVDEGKPARLLHVASPLSPGFS